jgi:hypothetical protein
MRVALLRPGSGSRRYDAHALPGDIEPMHISGRGQTNDGGINQTRSGISTRYSNKHLLSYRFFPVDLLIRTEPAGAWVSFIVDGIRLDGAIILRRLTATTPFVPAYFRNGQNKLYLY